MKNKAPQDLSSEGMYHRDNSNNIKNSNNSNKNNTDTIIASVVAQVDHIINNNNNNNNNCKSYNNDCNMEDSSNVDFDHENENVKFDNQQESEFGNRNSMESDVNSDSPNIDDRRNVEIGKDNIVEEEMNAGHNNNNNKPKFVQYKDHYTLRIPTSSIRYRGGDEKDSTTTTTTAGAARIIEIENAQLILEETYNTIDATTTISIRRASTITSGLRFLRIVYAVIAAFFGGCLFILSLQYLLFVSLDLLIEFGFTSIKGASPVTGILVFFAFPALIYGLSTALVIAGAFVLDTWDGHTLLSNFTFRRMNQLMVEWIYCILYLLVPCFLAVVLLFIKNERWWSITTQYWFMAATAFYCCFAVHILFYEIDACRVVMKNYLGIDSHKSWMEFIVRCIIYRQTRTYSGYKYITYLASGSVNQSGRDKHSNQIANTVQERTSVLAKFIMSVWYERLGRLLCYEIVYDPITKMEDTIDVRVFMTSNTWRLESFFCHSDHDSYVAIIHGPNAITRAQMKSSILCSIFGILLSLLFIISGAVYLETGTTVIIIIVVCGLIIIWFKISSNIRLYKILKNLIDAKNITTNIENNNNDDVDNQPNNKSEGFYLVNEVFRICKPSRTVCLMLFVVEVVVFFILPFIGLVSRAEYSLGIVFLVVAGISGIRYYINVAIILEEAGHMELVDGDNIDDRWRKQSRLGQIIGTVTRGRSLSTFMAILGVLWLCLTLIMIGALGQEVTATFDYPPFQFVYDFEYLQQYEIRYPNCQLTDALGAIPIDTMGDFAFIAGNAYRTENETQPELDGWFNGTAINNPDIVAQWRAENNIQSPVQFNLITFPDKGNFAIISIRGTSNAWDLFADAQLWSAAAFMQCLRFLLPAGRMWTPIIDNLIWFMTLIEGNSLESVSFYKITTAFVRYIQNQPEKYLGLGITGHSLGGGLAIISGAQAGALSVALSGPNAMLSRQSFRPSVSANSLNEYTFNIIPNRDIIAHIDDPAENFQNIRCLDNKMLNCHDSIRSLCEIEFTCGSRGRPVLCICHTTYGYPEPTPKNGTTRTFAEACGYEGSS